MGYGEVGGSPGLERPDAIQEPSSNLQEPGRGVAGEQDEDELLKFYQNRGDGYIPTRAPSTAPSFS